MVLVNLNNKIVVITGAGSGIGRALALGFCRDGARVVAFGRTRSKLEELAEEASSMRLHIVLGDVGELEDMRKLHQSVLTSFGKADILINNAALYPKRPFLDTSPEEWAHVIATNVTGVGYACRLFLPGMLEQGFGRIINVGTFAWLGPIPNAAAYSSSKGAIRPLTKALAAEIDRERFPDVLINELIPPIVRTGMSGTGGDPMDVYPHARFLSTLEKYGPTGQTFVGSTLYREEVGLRAKLRVRLQRSTRLARSLIGK